MPTEPPAKTSKPGKIERCGGRAYLRFVVWIFSVGMMLLGAGTGSGQAFPNKPIRIVTSGIGSNADFVARLIAQGLTASLGQQVIVDNRTSAGGIMQEIVAEAPPDGYTLLLTSAYLWILPLMQKMRYDPVRDFSPITLAVRTVNIIVAHPSLPVNSVKELVALAKTEPGKLNYGTTVTGSSNYLAVELFKAMSGVNMVRINYKNVAMALNDLIGGQVQLMFATSGSVTPHVKSGKLRALAVTSAQPSSTFPELPTVAASGVPGYESVSITGIYAPVKTPAAIINQLNKEIVRFLNQANVKEKFFNVGVETVASSPEQLAATMKSDMARMGKLIRDAGIGDK